MKSIWKYELKIVDFQLVEMPVGAEILSVANQNGKVCLWARVNPDQPTKRATEIEIIGTGKEFSDNEDRKFIGTVVVGPYVWHVFER